MLETRAAGILSARFALIFVSVFVSPVAVQTQVRTVRDVTDDLKNSHVLIPQFTGLDCDFGLEKECLWNWDADNFTGSTRGSTVYPGQNGFYRTNGEEVARLYSESSKNFFGPNKDSNNSTKGPFLYLLGRPLSDVANFTDKRIISQLIRESGNNCSVEIKLFYQNVKGAIIEFGTQNFAKAYSPIKEIIFTPANHTSHEGWKTFSIQYGRYVDPFSVSIDFKRSKFSETGSFIAIDDIKLVNCEPESSVPIDCSSKPSRNYGCPGGLGSPCLDGPSMLCDLKPDCPNGDDEKEDACYLMPREARCDFNNDDDFCGWRDPNGHLHRIAQWQRKKGQTKLEGIRGDLSHKNQGHYLYVSYEPGQDGTPGHGATLRSPAFPPPPKYNNNATSPYFKSCRIRLSYHMLSNSNTRRPGPLDLVVNFVNESSGSKSVMRPIHLTLDVPMGKNREGWIRWEAALPHQTQLRYYLSLIGSNGFGAKAELAVDDLSLSPQCFGQGVSPEHVGAWRYNMTDLEFCMYYGRSDCLSSKKSYGYKFSTCNAYGPLGPFPELCNEDYAGTSTSVMIGDVTKKGQESHQLGYVTGIQRWTVPATGIYTIIASGASGARGRQNNIQSYGDEIRALINLEANETIFILVGQMGISVCNNNGLLDDNSDCKGNDRQRRSPDPADYFYDLLQGEGQEQSETEDEEEEDDDNMYGKIIFAPFSSESNRGRQRRSVPAFMPRSSDNRRTPGKQARPDSMSELVRMMALSDGSTVPSTRMAANEDGSLDEEIIEQDKLHKQPQTSDEDHGRVHVSSDTMVQSQEKATYFNNVDQGPKQGGGGGGGATFIFRFIGNGTVQPLLIAAGGGGASDQQSTSLPGLHDAKGLVDPRATLAMLMKMVSQDDSDAGSGGGWNSNLSQACNFSIIHMNYQEKNKAQSTGFSMADSWMGGFPCSPNSEQWGGFGGGGAGCLGGGGGGGYIGGKGGTDQFTNGEGGWSYYNPDAILLVLDARTEAATSVVHMTNTGGQGNGAALEKLWKHQGQGRVFVIPSMPHDRSCQSNCSAFGAACVTLDPEMKKTQCVCPNGRLLDHINPKCNDELPLFVMAVIGVACVVTMAILGLLCMFLYTQYQRKHMQMLRRKMMSGPVVEGQLNRLRAMNVNVNINGVTMTEYNPNYEFGGGTCTLQDLREIPRENLRLVKALGQGAFGEVYQGFYKKSSSDTLEMSVAVKTLPELSSNQAEMDFLMEALIMSKFKHPNIVHFIGVCFEKHPRFIVLELLAGGDLKTFLRDSRPKPDRASPLVMRDLLLCAMDVAKGCEYLENNHFIHRDIAARNCLLTSKGPGRVAKIADFGMARDIYRGDYYRKGGKAMLPVKWMPPEAFLDGIFTSKTDVWSFGILLWEVMSLGYMPYPGRGNQEVMQLVTNGGRLEPPNYCPGPVYGLMCQCWHPIPEERPNFRTILERLGYCIQDPEVVMAPLPVCHRPMTSLENSRETSLSSGRGGGATTGSSADSGSGFSLPMRGAGAKGRPGQPNARSANVTPDSPGTTVTLAGASSSDYLVPLTGMPTRPAGLVTTDAQKRKSSRESIPASSPSDVPASDDEDSEMLLRRPSLPLTGEAETSFSCPPPSASARRAGGYTSLPQTESVTSKNRPNRRRRPSGSSSNKKLHQKSLSKNSINQIPPGSSSSSTSSCEPTSTRHPRSRLPSTSHPLEAAIEPPKRTTSVIASLQQDGVVNGLPLPPPPPRGYSDSSPSTKDDLSPVLPPLPPLPDEVRTPADKLPLDVSSLRAQHRHMVPYMNMDSNPGSPPRPSVITNPTPYVIHAPSSTNSSTTSTRPKATEPPSEISV